MATKDDLIALIKSTVTDRTEKKSIKPTTLGPTLEDMVENLAAQEDLAAINSRTQKIISTEIPSGVAVEGTEWIMYR